MKRIVLLCNGGLSTGILVKKMKAAAEAQDFACEISAAPVSDAEAVGAEADLILLGPQVRYRYGEIVEKYGDKGIPIQVIDQTDYGMMNGEKVLKSAIKLMKSAK